MRVMPIVVALALWMAQTARAADPVPPIPPAERPATRSDAQAVRVPLADPGVIGAPLRPLPRQRLAAETTLTASAGAFTWEEFDDHGRRLLKESGPLFGVNLDCKQFGRRFGVGFGGGLFGGRMDYDGQTQGGTPAATQTGYFGLAGEADLLARFAPAPRLTLEPFAGLGGRMWGRTIESRDDIQGYTEIWSMLYGRAGLGATCKFSANGRVFARGGWRLPIATEQDVDLSYSGVGTVKLHPRQQAAPFVEAGGRWNLLFVSFFYETLRFDKSDVLQLATVEQGRPGTLSFWQPESRSDLYGLRVGLEILF